MAKKIARYLIPTLGMMAILLFCVNATASIIGGAPNLITRSFSEQMNMILIGFGLIALGSYLERIPRR